MLPTGINCMWVLSPWLETHKICHGCVDGASLIISEQKQMDQNLLLTYNSKEYLTLMRLFLQGRRARPNPRTLRSLLLLAEPLSPQSGSSILRHEALLAAVNEG